LGVFTPKRPLLKTLAVTITSADPDFVSPAVKSMLRKKNKLMR